MLLVIVIIIDIILLYILKEGDVMLAMVFREERNRLMVVINDSVSGRICDILPFFLEGHPCNDGHQHKYAEEVA